MHQSPNSPCVQYKPGLPESGHPEGRYTTGQQRAVLRCKCCWHTLVLAGYVPPWHVCWGLLVLMCAAWIGMCKGFNRSVKLELMKGYQADVRSGADSAGVFGHSSVWASCFQLCHKGLNAGPQSLSISDCFSALLNLSWAQLWFCQIRVKYADPVSKVLNAICQGEMED